MTDAVALELEIAEWRRLVGSAILSFGEIELITHQFFVHVPADRISGATSRLRFSQRVDLIVEILEGFVPPTTEVVEFCNMLRKAKSLAETRNHIAHNPVMMNVYESRVTGNADLSRSISSARGEDRAIELHDMKEFAAAVEDLAAEMWLQLGQIQKSRTAG